MSKTNLTSTSDIPLIESCRIMIVLTLCGLPENLKSAKKCMHDKLLDYSPVYSFLAVIN